MRQYSSMLLFSAACLAASPIAASAQEAVQAAGLGDLRLQPLPVAGESNRPLETPAPVGPDAPIGETGGPVGAGQTDGPTRLGIFTLAPSVTTGSFFDDNVFATSTDRRSDVAFFARPEISAVAGGANYGIQSSAYVEGRKYATYASEDQVNAGASAAGVYQPDASTQMKGQLDYLHGHEDRGQGESAFIVLDRPVAFDQFDGAAAYNKRFGPTYASLGGSATGVVYQNDSLLGLPIDETYRNVVIPTLSGRVGYVVAPLTSVFADVTGNARRFNYDPLSSVGYRAVGGVLFEPGPGARFKGEASGGYMHQDYQGAGLQNVDSWTYGVSMSALVTNFLTFTLDGRREAKESGLFDGSLIQNQLGPTGGISLIESSIGGRFDYQVFNGLVASAGATYIDDTFLGTPQEDRYVSPNAALNYTLSKHLTASLDYHRLEYRPNIFGITGFQKDVILASLHGVF